MTNQSKKNQMKKEIKHVKNTMITKNHYLNKCLERYLPKEGRTTLIKEQRTLDTYEGLGDIKGADN